MSYYYFGLWGASEMMYARTILLRTIIFLDRVGTNLSIKDLKEKVFFDLDYFEENIHKLLLEGEISYIEGKVYPFGSKNLTNPLVEQLKNELDDDKGALAS
jgi:hypothetical protein